jgi:hypothetical protein
MEEAKGQIMHINTSSHEKEPGDLKVDGLFSGTG